MKFITIESHFGVPEHAIRPETRNICSKELVAMIYRVSEILYPDQKIEVLILPSEIGSYKDIFKILGISKSNIIAIGALCIAVMTYYQQGDTTELQAMKDCVELLKEDTNGLIIDIDDNKLNQLCEDHGVTRIKNNRYKVLEKDETIEYEETVIKSPDNKVLLQEKIERSEFKNMIVPLPEDEDFEQNNIEGVIELISLVIRQKKEGKGIARRGTYYGDDIIHNGIKILENGEEISFFMQDKEFKKKIQNQEITFASGDNVTVLFKLKTEIRGGITKNTYIHVQEVKQFNEAIITHAIKKKNNNHQHQGSLFDL